MRSQAPWPRTILSQDAYNLYDDPATPLQPTEEGHNVFRSQRFQRWLRSTGEHCWSKQYFSRRSQPARRFWTLLAPIAYRLHSCQHQRVFSTIAPWTLTTSHGEARAITSQAGTLDSKVDRTEVCCMELFCGIIRKR